uniref:RNA-directed DNA polymerase, eukaryota n=1 Tax=Tanacetum cinerariifolium TaxID=118510 RepID=A0A699GNF4_TANCI|nr:RNA-directed DNA polymerase, eukaryota [Tanacetum cinerariifolium]
MLDEKLVLVDDDGKPLKMVDDPINTHSDSEVEEVFKQRETYIEDSCDDNDFDNCGLTKDQLKIANAFDINIRGQLR